MGLLDIVTGGKSGDATAAQKAALAQLMAVQAPTAEQLTLPELQQYAVAMNMSPAQMQAFLQQNNALADQNIDQTGTDAQKAALSQLADVANAGPEGTATQRAQVEQINQDAARNLAGQRGAIDQQAQARGVAPGLLQAALSQQNAGQGAQDAHMAALNAQGNNYQQALQALASQGNLGSSLQGQQNAQANTIGQAQNAMQQFNAANQQNASAANAGYQQQANSQNTQNANQAGAANTGLSNQRTQYNAQVPETVFNNQLNKAQAIAGQYGNIANTATQQGQQNAGIFSGLLGAGATALGGPSAGMAAGSNGGYGMAPPGYANTQQYAPQGPGQSLNYAHGGMTHGPQCMCGGGMCMKSGGQVPGRAQVPGDSEKNDTVHANLSPGEVVIPRSMVQSHPEDIAALLQAMKHLRGSK